VRLTPLLFTLPFFTTTILLAGNDVASSLLQDMSDTTEIATQTNQNIDYQPFILSILHGKELSKLGYTTLGEALTLIPGVDIATNTMNNRTPIFRGSNPLAYGQSTLIIDGYAVNDHFFSNYNAYLDFPIELIERIEVVRGSGSFIEGVNGYAGTINVVTYAKNTTTKGQSGLVFSHVGSNQANRLGGWNRYYGDNWNLSVDAFTQSHNLHTPASVTDSLGFTSNADLGMDEKGLGFTLGYEKLELNGRINQYQSGSAFGNLNVLPNPDGKLQQPSWYIQGKYTLPLAQNSNLILNASIGQDSWKSDSRALPNGSCYNPKTGAVALCSMLSNSTGYTAYSDGYWAALMLESRRISGGAVVHYNGLDSHKLSLGSELSWDEAIDMYTIGNKIPSLGVQDYTVTLPFFNANAAKRKTANIYLSDSITFSNTLAAAATVGVMRTSDICQHSYGRISTVYQPTFNNIFKVMVSDGVRYPSFQEMYVTKSAYAAGNINVEPEHVLSLETQYLYKLSSDLTTGINLFYLKNTSQIVRDDTGMFQNLGQNIIHGLEAELHGHISSTDYINFSYSYIRGEISNNNEQADLPFAASHLVKAAFIHEFEDTYSLGIVGNYIGSKKRQELDTREALGDSYTLDLSLGWNMDTQKGCYVQAIAKNITDTIIRYPVAVFNDKSGSANLVIPYAQDYPVADRTFWLRAGWRF